MTPVIAQEFTVGRHKVRVSKLGDGGWTFTINGGDDSVRFPTATAAWAAGIRAAFILDAWSRMNGVA